jgi:two-component system phosphate regulon sensor histidine kinase PhoR
VSLLYSVLLIGAGALVGILISRGLAKQHEHKKLAASRLKQHEQREALLTIINGTNQAIFTVSSTGIIRIYNSALLSLIDTNQSLSGRRVDDILPLYAKDSSPVSLFQLMRDAKHFERDDLTLKFNDGDGIRLHLSVNRVQSAFSPNRQTADEGFVCIARDVTKQKSLEEERDEFVSVVSHELRTPVTIAEGTISNVQYFIENGADPVKLVPSLKEAHEQIVLLANMINDLGTLSRAERGAGDLLESIDIKELAETVYKSYQAQAKKKGLEMNLDLGAKLGTVTTSRLYLEEMLQNFVTNAIKYTQAGSVTLSAHRSQGGIEFAVSDTGIGISKTDIKHIFEKFYRSEDYRTRETSGTGLGLYVVTKLMHKLGTKVNVKSRLNSGSTFSFVITDATPKPKT